MRGAGASLLLALVLTTVVAGSAQSAAARAMIAEVVRTGSVIVRQVGFDPATDAPTPGSEPALDALLAVLREHDEWTFEVQVHTDEGRTPAQQLERSTARARTVVAWLTRRGIASARLVATGFGATRPLPNAPTDDPGLQYRRLELRKLNEE